MVMKRRRRNNKQAAEYGYRVDDLARIDPVGLNRKSKMIVKRQKRNTPTERSSEKEIK